MKKRSVVMMKSVNPQLALRKVIDETEMGSDRIISQSSAVDSIYIYAFASTDV